MEKNCKRVKSWTSSVFFAALIMATFWILPSYVNRARRLCPLRSDGTASVYAVPSYARKYNVNCSMCHTAYPVLNEVGRKFKESGYVLDREGENKDDKLIPEKFPWAFVVKGEPFAKQRSQKPEIRPINDIGMFVTDGSVAKNWSYWAEMHMRAADGSTNPQAFTFNFERARVGYHYNNYLNFLGGFGSILEGVDAYETLASPVHSIVGNRATDILDHARTLTGAFDQAAFDEHYLAVQGSVEKENVGALKYFTAVGAGWGAPSAVGKNGSGVDAGVGQGPMNYNFRLVADTLKGFALGAYYQIGKNDWTDGTTAASLPPGANVTTVNSGASPINKVQAYAVDALAEAFGFSTRAAFIDQRISPYAGGTNSYTSNRLASYIETFYTIKKDNAPWFAPMVRFEFLGDRTSGVAQNYKDYVVTALSYFPRENVRAIVEFWTNTKNRSGSVNGFCDNKIQTSVAVGF